MDITLPAPLTGARATLVSAETALQTACNERVAAHAAEIIASALADADPTNTAAQAALLLAQQRLNAAKQAIGDAENVAAHATEALQQEEAAWAAAQLTATEAAAQLAATQAALFATPPAPAAPTATPSPSATPDFASILHQNQLQNQQIMQMHNEQMMQHFSQPQAPTTTTAALPTTITAVPFDINKPPPNGKDPEIVGAEHRVCFFEAGWRGMLGEAGEEVGKEVHTWARRRAPPTRSRSGAWCVALLGVATALLLVQPAGSSLPPRVVPQHSHRVHTP